MSQVRPWSSEQGIKSPGHVDRYESIVNAVLRDKRRPTLRFLVDPSEQCVLDLIQNTFVNIVKTCCDANYLNRPRSDEVFESLMVLRDMVYKRAKGLTRQKSFVEKAEEWLGGTGQETFNERRRRRDTIYSNSTLKKKKLSRISSWFSKRSTDSEKQVEERRNVDIELGNSGNDIRSKNATAVSSSSENSLGSISPERKKTGSLEIHVKNITDIGNLFDEHSVGDDDDERFDTP